MQLFTAFCLNWAEGGNIMATNYLAQAQTRNTASLYRGTALGTPLCPSFPKSRKNNGRCCQVAKQLVFTSLINDWCWQSILCTIHNGTGHKTTISDCKDLSVFPVL